jgi:hypothetical protein
VSPVFVIALPRSRTAWLCNWLSEVADCFHEPLVECAGVPDLQRMLAPYCAGLVVVADTGFPFVIEALLDRFPKARFIVVQREAAAVARSLAQLGIPTDDFGKIIRAFERAVSILRRSERSTFVLDAHQLDDESVARRLWSWVVTGNDDCAIDDGFDMGRFSMLRDFRVEVMMDRVVERMRRNAQQLGQLSTTFEV